MRQRKTCQLTFGRRASRGDKHDSPFAFCFFRWDARSGEKGKTENNAKSELENAGQEAGRSLSAMRESLTCWGGRRGKRARELCAGRGRFSDRWQLGNAGWRSNTRRKKRSNRSKCSAEGRGRRRRQQTHKKMLLEIAAARSARKWNGR